MTGNLAKLRAILIRGLAVVAVVLTYAVSSIGTVGITFLGHDRFHPGRGRMLGWGAISARYGVTVIGGVTTVAAGIKHQPSLLVGPEAIA